MLILLFASMPNCYATESNEQIEHKEYAILREKVLGYNYEEMKQCLSYTMQPSEALTLFTSNQGTVTLNCAALRHIASAGHIEQYPSNKE